VIVLGLRDGGLFGSTVKIFRNGTQIGRVALGGTFEFGFDTACDLQFAAGFRKAEFGVRPGCDWRLQLGRAPGTGALEVRLLPSGAPLADPNGVETSFGLYKVRLFPDGHVVVRGARHGGDKEKLISIDFDTEFTKKRAIGRGAAALVTGGANLMVTGNQRGDVYLTIVTDKNTYALKAGASPQTNILNGRALEARGRAMLPTTPASATAPTPLPSVASRKASSSAPVSLGDRLRELAQLHADGLVTDDEYAALRQRALDGV
jgi:hypothetical protein